MRPILLVTIVIPLLGIVNAAITATDPASELQLLNHVMLPFLGEDLGAFLNPPENFSPSDNPDDIYFFLYNNPMAINQFEKIEYYDQASIRSLNWYKDAPVKILIHGFTQSQNSSMPAMIKNAYLERMRQTDEKFNIICVDWGRLAGSLKSTFLPIYTRATRNVEPAGKRVGELIVRLVELGIVTYENVHIVGFSLGAHVAGMAGSTVQSLTGHSIGRLTGLDPAGPLFYADSNISGRTLVKEDAHYVDVIHTSWGSYGIAKKVGDADFFPNFGLLPIQTQPYCLVAIANQRPLQVCSHNMAPVFYSMSILRDLNACKCTSYLDYTTFCRRVCYQPATFGEPWETTNTGDYYIHIPSRLFYEQEEEEQDQQMLRESPGNNKLAIVDAFMTEEQREKDRNASGLRESAFNQLDVKSSGRLIGMEVTPINLEQVVILNKMRSSQDGYLFWSGKIVPNQAVTILVPESLRDKFMTETSQFIDRIIRFDPVDMHISEKEILITRFSRSRTVEILAANLSTPLTPTAQSRLPQIFASASNPTKRYTFVIIYNTLGETFRLQQTTCSTGIWSRDYLPESEIQGHSTTIYRVESNGFLTGVTDCIAHYGATSGTGFIRLSTSTPFTGTNQAHGVTSPDDTFQIRSYRGRTHNNMARFVIY